MTRISAAIVLVGALLSPLPAHAQTAAEEATKLAGAGRYADAVQRFQEAVRQEPKNASLHLGLGLAYQALKDYAKAIHAVEAAVRLDPDAANPLYSLALLYEAAATDPAALQEQKTPAVQRRYWQKARQAWERFIGLEKDPQRRAVADGHLQHIKEALQ